MILNNLSGLIVPFQAFREIAAPLATLSLALRAFLRGGRATGELTDSHLPGENLTLYQRHATSLSVIGNRLSVTGSPCLAGDRQLRTDDRLGLPASAKVTTLGTRNLRHIIIGYRDSVKTAF